MHSRLKRHPNTTFKEIIITIVLITIFDAFLFGLLVILFNIEAYISGKPTASITADSMAYFVIVPALFIISLTTLTIILRLKKVRQIPRFWVIIPLGGLIGVVSTAVYFTLLLTVTLLWLQPNACSGDIGCWLMLPWAVAMSIPAALNGGIIAAGYKQYTQRFKSNTNALGLANK